MHRFKEFLGRFKVILKHELTNLTCIDSKHSYAVSRLFSSM